MVLNHTCYSFPQKIAIVSPKHSYSFPKNHTCLVKPSKAGTLQALLQANHCPGTGGSCQISSGFPHGFIVLALLNHVGIKSWSQAFDGFMYV